MVDVKFVKLRENAKEPYYASPEAAAADLCAAIDKPITLLPGHRAMIGTGISVEVLTDEPVVLLLFVRSGLACKRGITLSNGVGVIDKDYRGEIIVSLFNSSDEAYTIDPGERIAQLMVSGVVKANYVESQSLSDTERGAGGFGHTGK